MRTWTSILLTAAVAAFVGCQGETGGPGKTNPTTNPLEKITGKKDTFVLEKHLLPTSLKQGEKKEFEIKITRREGFHQTVKLALEPDKGIKVDFKDTEIKDPDTSAAGYIEADKEATVGEHMIKVTATTEGGDPVTVEYKVDVKAK
jgi:hypothetical protein